MLKEVSKEEWINIISDKTTSVFDEPKYLEIISNHHKTKLKYWVFFRNSKSLLGFAAHHKGNKIIVPDHYSYSSFWGDDSLGDYAFFDITDLAIKELKRRVRCFAFRLPPNIKDIRGFNLNGCRSEVRYTYFCKTNLEDFRKDLTVKLKKSSQQYFAFLVNRNKKEVLQQQILDFHLFGFRKVKIQLLQKLFQDLLDKELFHSFELIIDEQLKASALVIIDPENSLAYNTFLSTSKNNDDSMASSLLYQQIMKYLNTIGIQNFDLYGANMKGIANFKSGFKGELTNYFVVSFSRKDFLIDDLKNKMSVYFKKII